MEGETSNDSSSYVDADGKLSEAYRYLHTRVVRLNLGMPTVTGILVRCSDCGHKWQLTFSVAIIASTGDEITAPPGSINVECPRCGMVGTNHTETKAEITGEEVRGLFAVLRSVSLTGDDLRKLATIAAEAKEGGSRPEEVAEKIKTSIPRLRPVLTWIAENNISISTWLALLAALVMPIVGPEIAAILWPPTTAIVVESPSGEEHLLAQIANELRSALKASSATDRPHAEPKQGSPSDSHCG